MKKRNTAFIIILFFIFHLGFLSNSLFTQEYGEEDYKWFYFDRILPLDSLPVNAYKDAVDYQWDLRQNEGFSFSPQLAAWKSIGPSNAYNNGRIVRVKYDPTDDNTVYVCGHNGGV